jgi:hypothetical protein
VVSRVNMCSIAKGTAVCAMPTCECIHWRPLGATCFYHIAHRCCHSGAILDAVVACLAGKETEVAEQSHRPLVREIT